MFVIYITLLTLKNPHIIFTIVVLFDRITMSVTTICSTVYWPVCRGETNRCWNWGKPPITTILFRSVCLSVCLSLCL